jgi:hypothetical protein
MGRASEQVVRRTTARFLSTSWPSAPQAYMRFPLGSKDQTSGCPSRGREQMANVRSLIFAILPLLAAGACGSNTDTPSEPTPIATARPVATIVISPDSAILLPGGSRQLAAVLKDDQGNTLSNRPIVWSSSDSTKARVSGSGEVTAVALGETTVTATCEGKNATARVTILANDFDVRDRFARSLNARGVTLLDWEGYMANPKITLTFRPPAGVSFPLTATLTSSSPRVYFDRFGPHPTVMSAAGPSKILVFGTASSEVTVNLGLFPDRDATSTMHTLTLTAGSVTTTVPIHEIDQDTDTGLQPFRVKVDYGNDRTGFLNDPLRRAIIEQAANDWAFFVDDMQLDEVPIGAELGWIWDPHTVYTSGRYVQNTAPFRGFLLNAYGIDHDLPGSQIASTGGPNRTYQTARSGLDTLPINRSGGLNVEIKGTFCRCGYRYSTSDSDWWLMHPRAGDPMDFHQVGMHEIGHAFVYHPFNRRIEPFWKRGVVDDPDVVSYYGSAPPIDNYSHIHPVLDPASRRSAFGSEWLQEDFPSGRHLITKLDVLILQAAGYKLRRTSSLRELEVTGTTLPNATAGTAYTSRFTAAGGVPDYEFRVVSGSLPPGLILDSFEGTVSGTPTTSGTFTFTIEVRDSARRSATGIRFNSQLTVP